MIDIENGELPIIADSIDGGRLVAFFLMASYLYYERAISLMDDGQFDLICKKLDEKWDEINHPHKYLIEREALSSTTGFYIRNYPLMVKSAACTLAHKRGLM